MGRVEDRGWTAGAESCHLDAFIVLSYFLSQPILWRMT